MPFRALFERRQCAVPHLVYRLQWTNPRLENGELVVKRRALTRQMTVSPYVPFVVVLSIPHTLPDDAAICLQHT